MMVPSVRRLPRIHSFLLLGVICLVLPALRAQPAGPSPGWSQRVHAGVVHQTSVDIDGGGSFDVTRTFVGADFSRSINKETAIGFGLGAGLDSYGFADTTPPWGDLTRLEASFTYSRRLNQDWGIRLAPSVQSYVEEGASVSDGIVAGLVASATRTINPDLRLGLGVAAFAGLEETRVFPFLAVNWRISETWSLQNPFRPGPAGPAGLELVRSSDSWEFAFGGAYRSYRFRLGDDGPAADGVGEFQGVPIFLRASRDLDARWQVDFYAGVIVAGTLELEDNSGHGLAKSDFDPAPLVALTLNGRF